MNSFDLYLGPPQGSAGDARAAWRALTTSPWLRPTDDPGRLLYRNEDTSVYFHILLGDSLLAARRQAEGHHATDEGMPEHLDAFGDTPPSETGSARDREERLDEQDDDERWDDDEEDDDEDEEWEEEEDDDEPATLPPLTAVVPLFHPTFFLLEALHVADSVCAAAEFRVTLGDGVREEEDGARGEEDEGDSDSAEAPPEDEPSTAELVDAWHELHRRLWLDIPEPKVVQIWSDERSADFHAWGTALSELRERYASDGIEVAPAQPARHDQLVKTLCVWNLGRGAVLPRSDLVLMRWESRPRGLLRRRKVEEAIATGEEVWNALAGIAEAIEDPVPALVVRGIDLESSGLGSALGELGSIRTSDVRRTELGGVIDFAVEDAEGENPRV